MAYSLFDRCSLHQMKQFLFSLLFLGLIDLIFFSSTANAEPISTFSLHCTDISSPPPPFPIDPSTFSIVSCPTIPPQPTPPISITQPEQWIPITPTPIPFVDNQSTCQLSFSPPTPQNIPQPQHVYCIKTITTLDPLDIDPPVIEYELIDEQSSQECLDLLTAIGLTTVGSVLEYLPPSNISFTTSCLTKCSTSLDGIPIWVECSTLSTRIPSNCEENNDIFFQNFISYTDSTTSQTVNFSFSLPSPAYKVTRTCALTQCSTTSCTVSTCSSTPTTTPPQNLSIPSLWTMSPVQLTTCPASLESLCTCNKLCGTTFLDAVPCSGALPTTSDLFLPSSGPPSNWVYKTGTRASDCSTGQFEHITSKVYCSVGSGSIKQLFSETSFPSLLSNSPCYGLSVQGGKLTHTINGLGPCKQRCRSDTNGVLLPCSDYASWTSPPVCSSNMQPTTRQKLKFFTPDTVYSLPLGTMVNEVSNSLQCSNYQCGGCDVSPDSRSASSCTITISLDIIDPEVIPQQTTTETYTNVANSSAQCNYACPSCYSERCFRTVPIGNDPPIIQPVEGELTSTTGTSVTCPGSTITDVYSNINDWVHIPNLADPVLACSNPQYKNIAIFNFCVLNLPNGTTRFSNPSKCSIVPATIGSLYADFIRTVSGSCVTRCSLYDFGNENQNWSPCTDTPVTECSNSGKTIIRYRSRFQSVDVASRYRMTVENQQQLLTSCVKTGVCTSDCKAIQCSVSFTLISGQGSLPSLPYNGNSDCSAVDLSCPCLNCYNTNTILVPGSGPYQELTVGTKVICPIPPSSLEEVYTTPSTLNWELTPIDSNTPIPTTCTDLTQFRYRHTAIQRYCVANGTILDLNQCITGAPVTSLNSLLRTNIFTGAVCSQFCESASNLGIWLSCLNPLSFPVPICSATSPNVPTRTISSFLSYDTAFRHKFSPTLQTGLTTCSTTQSSCTPTLCGSPQQCTGKVTLLSDLNQVFTTTNFSTQAQCLATLSQCPCPAKIKLCFSSSLTIGDTYTESQVSPCPTATTLQHIYSPTAPGNLGDWVYIKPQVEPTSCSQSQYRHINYYQYCTHGSTIVPPTECGLTPVILTGGIEAKYSYLTTTISDPSSCSQFCSPTGNPLSWISCIDPLSWSNPGCGSGNLEALRYTAQFHSADLTKRDQIITNLTPERSSNVRCQATGCSLSSCGDPTSCQPIITSQSSQTFTLPNIIVSGQNSLCSAAISSCPCLRCFDSASVIYQICSTDPQIPCISPPTDPGSGYCTEPLRSVLYPPLPSISSWTRIGSENSGNPNENNQNPDNPQNSSTCLPNATYKHNSLKKYCMVSGKVRPPSECGIIQQGSSPPVWLDFTVKMTNLQCVQKCRGPTPEGSSTPLPWGTCTGLNSWSIPNCSIPIELVRSATWFYTDDTTFLDRLTVVSTQKSSPPVCTKSTCSSTICGQTSKCTAITTQTEPVLTGGAQYTPFTWDSTLFDCSFQNPTCNCSTLCSTIDLPIGSLVSTIENGLSTCSGGPNTLNDVYSPTFSTSWSYIQPQTDPTTCPTSVSYRHNTLKKYCIVDGKVSDITRCSDLIGQQVVGKQYSNFVVNFSPDPSTCTSYCSQNGISSWLPCTNPSSWTIPSCSDQSTIKPQRFKSFFLSLDQSHRDRLSTITQETSYSFTCTLPICAPGCNSVSTCSALIAPTLGDTPVLHPTPISQCNNLSTSCVCEIKCYRESSSLNGTPPPTDVDPGYTLGSCPIIQPAVFYSTFPQTEWIYSSGSATTCETVFNHRSLRRYCIKNGLISNPTNCIDPRTQTSLQPIPSLLYANLPFIIPPQTDGLGSPLPCTTRCSRETTSINPLWLGCENHGSTWSIPSCIIGSVQPTRRTAKFHPLDTSNRYPISSVMVTNPVSILSQCQHNTCDTNGCQKPTQCTASYSINDSGTEFPVNNIFIPGTGTESICSSVANECTCNTKCSKSPTNLDEIVPCPSFSENFMYSVDGEAQKWDIISSASDCSSITYRHKTIYNHCVSGDTIINRSACPSLPPSNPLFQFKLDFPTINQCTNRCSSIDIIGSGGSNGSSLWDLCSSNTSWLVSGKCSTTTSPTAIRYSNRFHPLDTHYIHPLIPTSILQTSVSTCTISSCDRTVCSKASTCQSRFSFTNIGSTTPTQFDQSYTIPSDCASLSTTSCSCNTRCSISTGSTLPLGSTLTSVPCATAPLATEMYSTQNLQIWKISPLNPATVASCDSSTYLHTSQVRYCVINQFVVDSALCTGLTTGNGSPLLITVTGFGVSSCNDRKCSPNGILGTWRDCNDNLQQTWSALTCGATAVSRSIANFRALDTSFRDPIQSQIETNTATPSTCAINTCSQACQPLSCDSTMTINGVVWKQSFLNTQNECNQVSLSCQCLTVACYPLLTGSGSTGNQPNTNTPGYTSGECPPVPTTSTQLFIGNWRPTVGSPSNLCENLPISHHVLRRFCFQGGQQVSDSRACQNLPNGNGFSEGALQLPLSYQFTSFSSTMCSRRRCANNGQTNWGDCTSNLVNFWTFPTCTTGDTTQSTRRLSNFHPDDTSYLFPINSQTETSPVTCSKIQCSTVECNVPTSCTATVTVNIISWSVNYLTSAQCSMVKNECPCNGFMCDDLNPSTGGSGGSGDDDEPDSSGTGSATPIPCQFTANNDPHFWHLPTGITTCQSSVVPLFTTITSCNVSDINSCRNAAQGLIPTASSTQVTCTFAECTSCGVPQVITSATWGIDSNRYTLPISTYSLLGVPVSNNCACNIPKCVPSQTTLPTVNSPQWSTCHTLSQPIIASSWTYISQVPNCNTNGVTITPTVLNRIARCFSSDNKVMMICPTDIQPVQEWTFGTGQICSPPVIQTCGGCNSPALTCDRGSVTLTQTYTPFGGSSTTQTATYQYTATCPTCTCGIRCKDRSIQAGTPALLSHYSACLDITSPTQNQWSITSPETLSITCDSNTFKSIQPIPLQRSTACVATGLAITSGKIWPNLSDCSNDPLTYPITTTSYTVDCIRPTCEMCSEATNCYAQFGNLLTFPTIPLEKNQCANQCQCDLLCSKGMVTSPCRMVPNICSSDTFEELYTINNECIHTTMGWALECSAADLAKKTQKVHSCDRKCVLPEIFVNKSYDTIGTTVNESDLNECDDKFARPPGDASCTNWTPTMSQRRVICIEQVTVGNVPITRIIECPVDQRNDTTQAASGECRTVCTRSSYSPLLLNSQYTLTPDQIEFCNEDSFRVKQCQTQVNARNVYCAIIGENGPNSMRITQLSGCQSTGPNFTTIQSKDCRVGCYMNIGSLDGDIPLTFDVHTELLKTDGWVPTTTQLSPSQGIFHFDCHPNSFRRSLETTSCPLVPVLASTKRTALCVSLSNGRYRAVLGQDECNTVQLTAAVSRTWSETGSDMQCTPWCFRIATTTVPSSFSLIQSSGEGCIPNLYKPTSGIDHCDPIPASLYRTSWDTYERPDGRIMARQKDRQNPSIEFRSAQSTAYQAIIWQPNCLREHRCQIRTDAMTIEHYTACNSIDLRTTYCSNRCQNNYPIPSNIRKCLKTRDWSGNVISGTTIAQDQGNICGIEPTYPCPCDQTKLCLANEQEQSSFTPIECREDSGWTNASVCGEVDRRKAYLKTAVGGNSYVSSVQCTPETCPDAVFAVTTRVPVNFAAICTPEVVCTITAEANGGIIPDPVDGQSCTGSDDVIFGICNEENCNARTDHRLPQIIFAQKKLTLNALTVKINSLSFTTPIVQTSYRDKVSQERANLLQSVVGSRPCNCQIQPWCRKIKAENKLISELTFTDLISCDTQNDGSSNNGDGDDDQENILPCSLSCTEFERNGAICRQENGSLTEIPSGELCGSTHPTPICPQSHLCESTDFCTPLFESANVFDSPECDEFISGFDTSCWAYNPNPIGEQTEFSQSSCTIDQSTTYFSRRNVECLTFYRPEPHTKLPLPQGILNIPSNLCQNGPEATDRRPDCQLYTSCPASIIGPLTILPLSDLTVLSEQFHEHGAASVSWQGHRGPTIATDIVQVSYALAGDEIDPTLSTLTWNLLPQTGRLDAKSVTITFPVLSTTTTVNSNQNSQNPVVNLNQNNQNTGPMTTTQQYNPNTRQTTTTAQNNNQNLQILQTDTNNDGETIVTAQISTKIFIKIHIQGSKNYLYYTDTISVQKFSICTDLDCNLIQSGSFECYVPLTPVTNLQRSAICRCDSSIDVIWTSGECNQIQTCLDSSIRCKNDGIFPFDREKSGFCSSTCTCPGGQSGQFCEGPCPTDSCNLEQGTIAPNSRKCQCSTCFSGYSGSNCQLCSRLTALKMNNPTNSAPQLFGQNRRRTTLFTNLSNFFAKKLNIPSASISIDGTRTTLTNTTLTLVISLSGQCTQGNVLENEVVQNGPNFYKNGQNSYKNSFQKDDDGFYEQYEYQNDDDNYDNGYYNYFETEIENELDSSLSTTTQNPSSSNFKPLQQSITSDPASAITISTAVAAWTRFNLDILTDSPELQMLVLDGQIVENTEKMSIVSPVSCIKNGSCPDFSRTSCQLEPDHPRCRVGQGINGGLVIAIIIPLGCIIVFILLGILLWHCGCCDEHPEELELEKKRREEREKEQKVVPSKSTRLQTRSNKQSKSPNDDGTMNNEQNNDENGQNGQNVDQNCISSDVILVVDSIGDNSNNNININQNNDQNMQQNTLGLNLLPLPQMTEIRANHIIIHNGTPTNNNININNNQHRHQNTIFNNLTNNDSNATNTNNTASNSANNNATNSNNNTTADNSTTNNNSVNNNDDTTNQKDISIPTGSSLSNDKKDISIPPASPLSNDKNTTINTTHPTNTTNKATTNTTPNTTIPNSLSNETTLTVATTSSNETTLTTTTATTSTIAPIDITTATTDTTSTATTTATDTTSTIASSDTTNTVTDTAPSETTPSDTTTTTDDSIPTTN